MPAVALAQANAPYAAVQASSEVPVTVAVGVPATVQTNRLSAKGSEGLPSDAAFKPTYVIFIPRSPLLPQGTLMMRDTVTDDTGLRYQVVEVECSPLGWKLVVQIEET
jgi:hypothetical protein